MLLPWPKNAAAKMVLCVYVPVHAKRTKQSQRISAKAKHRKIMAKHIPSPLFFSPGWGGEVGGAGRRGVAGGGKGGSSRPLFTVYLTTVLGVGITMPTTHLFTWDACRLGVPAGR